MSRRKDNKGRVLRTGESQRKDLIYQYRYTDALRMYHGINPHESLIFNIFKT